MIHEVVSAAMNDRDDVPDTISISGQINCRADLEGLPDVSFPLTGLNTVHIDIFTTTYELYFNVLPGFSVQLRSSN